MGAALSDEQWQSQNRVRHLRHNSSTVVFLMPYPAHESELQLRLCQIESHTIFLIRCFSLCLKMCKGKAQRRELIRNHALLEMEAKRAI